MKVRLVLQDPDGVYESFKDAGMDMDTLEGPLQHLFKNFFLFGEVVTIELDTETRVATVIPVDKW